MERTAPHSYTEPCAVAKSLDKFIHYNQAVGHDAWQGLARDYNIFTPLGFHHMVDQISVTGDQCAALPQGHKHYCDRFDKEPRSFGGRLKWIPGNSKINLGNDERCIQWNYYIH